MDSPPRELSEAQVRQILLDIDLWSQLSDIVSLISRDLRFLYISRTVNGRDKAEVLGSSVLDHISPNMREPFRALFMRAWDSGEPVTAEGSTDDGQYWYENQLYLVRHPELEPVMFCATRDITARKRAERALLESEAQRRMALSASGVGTFFWGAHDDRLVWDEPLCRIFGVSLDEAPRDYRSYTPRIHPDDRALVEAHIAQSLKTGAYPDLEHRVVRPNGEVRYVFCRATPELDAQGQVIAIRGGLIDITDRKRLEEQLRQAHKMEAIGRLTAGIAHNFNNLLSVMLSNVELCRKVLPGRVSPQLDDIEHATERASELVRQMMVLARQKSSSEMVNLDLTELVERTLRICRTTFQRSISLEVVAEPELPPVRGRAGDLEQVLLNICINARDVLVESRTQSPSIVVHVGRSADGCLHMSVADNGPGIPLELRTHIFEPFFTTKAVGSGTGLGLATAYAIVREHGGRISCYDNPGGGALFSVELPISRSKGRSEPPRAEVAPTGDETILVVDDEAMLRRALTGVLREAGFKTLEAADGREALQLLQSEPRVDLMVLDRAMPVMSGDELLRELKRQASSLPVLLLTGQPGECEGAAAVLLKPPRSVQLLKTIRTLLDRAKGS